jgi:hypothetical protein
MSRPQKIVPPVKGSFNEILLSVAMGSGAGKRAAIKLSTDAGKASANPDQPKPIAPQPRKP